LKHSKNLPNFLCHKSCKCQNTSPLLSNLSHLGKEKREEDKKEKKRKKKVEKEKK
jgi:hypothetical protein